jgi:hypothetical protein
METAGEDGAWELWLPDEVIAEIFANSDYLTMNYCILVTRRWKEVCTGLVLGGLC